MALQPRWPAILQCAATKIFNFFTRSFSGICIALPFTKTPSEFFFLFHGVLCFCYTSISFSTFEVGTSSELGTRSKYGHAIFPVTTPLVLWAFAQLVNTSTKTFLHPSICSIANSNRKKYIVHWCMYKSLWRGTWGLIAKGAKTYSRFRWSLKCELVGDSTVVNPFFQTFKRLHKLLFHLSSWFSGLLRIYHLRRSLVHVLVW